MPFSIACCSPSSLTALVPILGAALPDRWSRDCGTWTPVATIVALVRLVGSAGGYRPLCRHMNQDLGNLFGRERLHPSAFTQARQRLAKRPEILEAAFAAVYDHAQAARRTRSVTYGDFTLVAIDATSIPLQATPALIKHFKTPGNQHGPSAAPHALVSVAWDVGANQPIDYAVAASDCGELTVSKQLLERLPARALVIADRLYASRHVISDLVRARRHGLIRVPSGSNGMHEVQEFVASGKLDAVGAISCFSRVDPKRYAPGTTVRVRFIRGADDQHIYITTLIDEHVHAREQLLLLYTKRWRIETAFRELKMWTNLTSIRARLPLLVEQEILGILIYAVLLSELDAMALEAYQEEIAALQPQPAAETAGKKQRGKVALVLRQNIVRFNRAVAVDAIPSILACAIAGDPHQLARSIRITIECLWAFKVTVKHGRSYPRTSTRPHSKWNRMREKTAVS
jgi:Transposase DDE domain